VPWLCGAFSPWETIPNHATAWLVPYDRPMADVVRVESTYNPAPMQVARRLLARRRCIYARLEYVTDTREKHA